MKLSQKPETSGSVRFLSHCGVGHAEPPSEHKQVLNQKETRCIQGRSAAALSPLLRFQIVFRRDLFDRFRSRVEPWVDVDTFLSSTLVKSLLGNDGGEGVGGPGAVKGNQEAFRGERSQRAVDWDGRYASGRLRL